jgi:hypothetical protein
MLPYLLILLGYEAHIQNIKYKHTLCNALKLHVISLVFVIMILMITPSGLHQAVKAQNGAGESLNDLLNANNADLGPVVAQSSPNNTGLGPTQGNISPNLVINGSEVNETALVESQIVNQLSNITGQDPQSIDSVLNKMTAKIPKENVTSALSEMASQIENNQTGDTVQSLALLAENQAAGNTELVDKAINMTVSPQTSFSLLPELGTIVGGIAGGILGGPAGVGIGSTLGGKILGGIGSSGGGGKLPQGPGGVAPQGPGGVAPQGPGGVAPQGPGGVAPQGPGGVYKGSLSDLFGQGLKCYSCVIVLETPSVSSGAPGVGPVLGGMTAQAPAAQAPAAQAPAAQAPAAQAPAAKNLLESALGVLGGTLGSGGGGGGMGSVIGGLLK